MNGTLKYVLWLAGAAGAFVGGFATAKHVSSAQAAQDDQRLAAIELKLENIAQDINMAKTDVRVIKCYLRLENICPPDVRP